jgi:hypothetical protein
MGSDWLPALPRLTFKVARRRRLAEVPQKISTCRVISRRNDEKSFLGDRGEDFSFHSPAWRQTGNDTVANAQSHPNFVNLVFELNGANVIFQQLIKMNKSKIKEKIKFK